MSAEDLVEERQAVLDRVARFRRAARAIVRTEHATVKRRCLGLLELVDMARAENDAITARWSELAIWSESRSFLGVDDERPVLPPEPYEHRQRRLRSEGFETCPRCFARIATDEDLRRWSRLRRDDAKRRRVHEEAVS